MSLQNVSDLIIAIATATVPVVFAYIAKFLKDNKQATSILDAVAPLAKDAVVAMQKLGATEAIGGSVKKARAVQIVAEALSDLGFNETDETTLANAVESAYAQLKADGALDAYPQATKPDDKQEEINKTEAELTSLKEQEAATQKQVDALKGAQN